MTLSEFFIQYPKAALGFSGGIDSAYLLAAAKAMGADIKPYFVRTPFQPSFELDDARQMVPDLTVLELDVLAGAQVACNPADRCYHCKKAIFSLLLQRCREDGYDTLLDGTNASDDIADRPGYGALQELGVVSPLRLCGLTKEQIRAEARALGLKIWNKPAYACLATRIPTGTTIDPEILHRVEAAEDALYQLGYRDFRVRVFHNAARIQLHLTQFPRSAEAYLQVLQAVQPYFDPVLLDLQAR